MPKKLWNNVLHSLESDINKQSFNMWLRDTEPLSIDGSTLRIKVMDDVTRRHINEQYLGLISGMLKRVSGFDYTCEFITQDDYMKESEKPPILMKSHLDIPSVQPAAAKGTYKSVLNPNYTFENFVVGPNNQLAHAAAYSVSKAPATQINPLFLYGVTGLGKTHLMQAIGHYVIHEKPYLKVLYVPTEQFINEFISSIRTNTTQSFKIKYRDVDILLIDDIQFIEKKEETQNEFFHTFNTLYDNKKQIIISSDRPPKELSTLEERLRTRFEWGMIIDIQPPNLETREAILRNKAERDNIDLSDDVLNFIARRIKSSIRALESALVRLKMVSSLVNEPITISHAKIHLRELFDDDINRRVTVADIMNKVSEKTGVSVHEIVSKSRHSRIIQPRFTAMYISRQLTDLTTVEIGKEFGDRDHSTVLNAVSKIEEDMANNPEFREYVEDILLELKS